MEFKYYAYIVAVIVAVILFIKSRLLKSDAEDLRHQGKHSFSESANSERLMAVVYVIFFIMFLVNIPFLFHLGAIIFDYIIDLF